MGQIYCQKVIASEKKKERKISLFERNDALSGNKFYGYDEYVDENIIFKIKISFWNVKSKPV